MPVLLICALLLWVPLNSALKQQSQMDQKLFSLFQPVRDFQQDGSSPRHYSLLHYFAIIRTKSRKYVAGAEFNAQPVIFVPGNAGSGQEIGAFWHFLRWKGVESSVDFDLFALDFNGEPTALDTNFIEGQAKFLLKTIQFLLAKYKKYWTAVGKPTKDTKIILIGYSMGGVVIKTAMLMNGSMANSGIAFALALASPIAVAPFYFDMRFIRHWEWMNNSNGKFLRLISLNCGAYDGRIEAEWTRVHGHGQHSFSTAELDGVWDTCEHNAIIRLEPLFEKYADLSIDYAVEPGNFVQNWESKIYKHFHAAPIPADADQLQPPLTAFPEDIFLTILEEYLLKLYEYVLYVHHRLMPGIVAIFALFGIFPDLNIASIFLPIIFIASFKLGNSLDVFLVYLISLCLIGIGHFLMPLMIKIGKCGSFRVTNNSKKMVFIWIVAILFTIVTWNTMIIALLVCFKNIWIFHQITQRRHVFCILSLLQIFQFGLQLPYLFIHFVYLREYEEAAMPLSSSPSKWLPIISFPTDHFYNSNLLMVTFSAVHHFHDVPAVLGIWFTKAIKMAQIADLLLATVLLAIALLWSSTALTVALDDVALSAAFYIVFIVRYHLSL